MFIICKYRRRVDHMKAVHQDLQAVLMFNSVVRIFTHERAMSEVAQMNTAEKDCDVTWRVLPAKQELP